MIGEDYLRILDLIIVGGRTNFNDDNNNTCNYVLSLSFEELPSYLKHCFLYLAHFPEDYKIKVENLSYYWAAEGIFQPRHYDGETIRDVGDSYMDELVRRNMVISERDVETERFETCHLHDMMREVCLLKAKKKTSYKLPVPPFNCKLAVYCHISQACLPISYYFTC
ncbi:hypothetical protein AXX17_AT1G52500 [Arabidopsis thaliana]|uniref:Disease resistance protein winged helix domain-containing protein n=1 Tax=Arabidopsis thaliana TaxID=3702 RepID=A0A178WF99_ARATH|nr:hypothetical protein AXX17_AT1G52500 [Arabidopsis thaliana]